MRDPFANANRRIIRRLGIPTVMVTEQGVTLPEIKGVFIHPEGEGLIKGRGGGLEFKSSRPTLRVMSEDVVGLSQEWRIIVKGKEYFPAEYHEDGSGTTLIYLSVEIADLTESEVMSSGATWR
jgi:hypothetical protein